MAQVKVPLNLTPQSFHSLHISTVSTPTTPIIKNFTFFFLFLAPPLETQDFFMCRFSSLMSLRRFPPTHNVVLVSYLLVSAYLIMLSRFLLRCSSTQFYLVLKTRRLLLWMCEGIDLFQLRESYN